MELFERTIYYRTPTGGGRNIVLRIWTPFEEDGVFYTRWSIDELNPTGTKVSGEDGLHSLTRSIKMACELLEMMASEGAEFQWIVEGGAWPGQFAGLE